MYLTTVSVFGLIWATVPSRPFVTQTKPPPTAIPSGPFPTWIVSMTTCLTGSILETLWASTLVAQIES